MGFSGLRQDEAALFEGWFSCITLLDVTNNILRRAASLRRVRRMSLGDSIIAATALEHGLSLITRNIDDFKHLSGLELINPFDA